MAEVSRLRDYQRWHLAYADPDSELSWRLEVVRGYLREALDERAGPLRVLSSCAGDGRDILGVLAGRADRARVAVRLVEIDPSLARAARVAGQAAGVDLEVRVRDAGTTDAYVGAAPADIVLLVGILGNISDTDVETTIRTAPQLCRPGATCVWSRGVEEGDTNDQVRGWFVEAGFTELHYAQSGPTAGAALGAMRYDGPSVELVPGRRLFTFLR